MAFHQSINSSSSRVSRANFYIKLIRVCVQQDLRHACSLEAVKEITDSGDGKSAVSLGRSSVKWMPIVKLIRFRSMTAGASLVGVDAPRLSLLL